MGIVIMNTFNIFVTDIISSYEFIIFVMFGFIYLLSFVTFEPITIFLNSNHKIFEDLLISIMTGIMLPFGLLISIQLLNNESNIQSYIIYLTSLYYAHITETVDLLFVLSIALLAALFIIYIIACSYSFYKRCNNEKQVIIVRGVPGVGKISYIISKEYKDCEIDEFKTCYWQNYYGKGLSYKYRPNETKQAELWSLMRFINSIVRRIPRIYIVSTFEKKWQYEVYVYLAQIMRYNVRIVELECPDVRHLKYFQQRSTHNVPFSRALRIYNDWEYDERAILQDPYIEPDLKGDSIPLNDNNITKQSLDKELDEYFKSDKQYNKKEYIVDNRVRSQYTINYVDDDDKNLFGL